MEPDTVEHEPIPLANIDLDKIDSVVLRRLIEEVRNDQAEGIADYNRTYNRWMGTPGQPSKYNRTYNRHNR